MEEIKIRELDYGEDVNAVVKLLRTGLSDGKNEEWLRWKHLDNPFGVSPAFVGVMGGEIVGVRFFLRWQFRSGDDTYDALRPVDTVTHPKARGKGIFKRLTLHGLEAINPGDRQLVFNTPNGNSLPGYLKMGWELYPRTYDYYYTLLLYRSPVVAVLSEQPPSEVSNYANYPSGGLTTHKTADFLAWRYRSPRYKYAYRADGGPGCLVYRIITVKGMSVLSISDYLGPAAGAKELINATAAASGIRVAQFLDGTFVYSADWPLKLRRGNSKVAVRSNEAIESIDLRLSAGDLESIL